MGIAGSQRQGEDASWKSPASRPHEAEMSHADMAKWLSHRSLLPVFLGLDSGWDSVTEDASPERYSWELRPWQGSPGPPQGTGL